MARMAGRDGFIAAFLVGHLAAGKHGDYSAHLAASLLLGDVGEWLKLVPC